MQPDLKTLRSRGGAPPRALDLSLRSGCTTTFPYLSYILALGEAHGDLGRLKLDEIDAATSFLMLPMARNGFKWPVMSPFFPYFPIFFL